MDVIQNNTLIAEFMTKVDWYWEKDDNQGDGEQLYFQPFDTEWQQMYPSEMLFSTSWEWLNSVVEKINANVNYHISNGIPETGKKYNCAAYVSKDFKTESRNRLIEIEDNTSQIDVTYRVVVEFIKWYNTATKNN